MYVTPTKQTQTLGEVDSPCLFILKNETRQKKDKPNEWSKMITNQIRVTVTKMPAGG